MLRWILSRRLLVGWLLGMATVLALAGTYGLLTMSGLIFDTRADKPHSRVFAWAIHRTMQNAVHRRADDPGDHRLPTTSSVLAGAAAYEDHCVACHGGPGVARAKWVSAILPTPPYLIDAPVHWNRAELFLLVRDGVKMSGMPAWGEILSRSEMTNIVDFLQVMPKLTPDQYARIRTEARRPAPGPDTPSKFPLSGR